jgi:Ca2+-binding RTX toxin-like protein
MKSGVRPRFVSVRGLRWALAPLIILASLIAGVGTAGPVYAESCLYIEEAAGGSWHDAGNWDCGHVPGLLDTALIGTNGNDLIDGRGGIDLIFGLGGNDCIVGGDGADIVVGGAGNDIILGGGGNDLLDGGAGNDTIDGGSGNDFEFGQGGNDTLTGGAGNDLIAGGSGTDACDSEAEFSCET